MKESESESYSVVSDFLQPYGLYSPWNSPAQNTEAFPFSRGTSPPRNQLDLLHCMQIFYQLSYQGSHLHDIQHILKTQLFFTL